jgi:hypothetical protein
MKKSPVQVILTVLPSKKAIPRLWLSLPFSVPTHETPGAMNSLTVNNELGWTWKETVVAEIWVLYLQFSVGGDVTDEHQSRYRSSGRDFNPGRLDCDVTHVCDAIYKKKSLNISACSFFFFVVYWHCLYWNGWITRFQVTRGIWTRSTQLAKPYVLQQFYSERIFSFV